MARSTSPAIPPAVRKSLAEWIEYDDGNTTGSTPPACSRQAQALHALVLIADSDGRGKAPRPLAPPQGLRLPPLG